MGEPVVMGLDLSLRATGLFDGRRAWRRGYSLTEDAPLSAQVDRVRTVASEVVVDVRDRQPRPDLVVVEGPSFGSQGSAVHQLAGLWFMVVAEIQYARIPYAVVAPQTRAMYATGSGGATKRQVKMAVRLWWPQFPVADDNEADAVALAGLGFEFLGLPLEHTPSPDTLDGVVPWHASTVARVRWPDLGADVSPA